MRLREARFRKGLTQFKLRICTGIHQSRISHIETGQVEPRLDEKERIEAALGLEVDWNDTRQFGNRPPS
jgi:transcriptional regulator with XRE-family HTH domain